MDTAAALASEIELASDVHGRSGGPYWTRDYDHTRRAVAGVTTERRWRVMARDHVAGLAVVVADDLPYRVAEATVAILNRT